MIDLPYKMVFAVGTIDSLYVFDTQSVVPRYAVTNIHLQALTDIAWNGSSLLAVSSADGYVSFFIFEKNELGVPEDPAILPEELKASYENYLNIDINKSIYQGQNGIFYSVELFINKIIHISYYYCEGKEEEG